MVGGSMSAKPHTSRLRTLGAALACVGAVVLLAPATSAARAAFLVPVNAQSTGFGMFVETLGGNGVGPLQSAFGIPSSTAFSRGLRQCTLRWASLGIRARVSNFGRPFSPCRRGYFVEARLADPRWHTAAGLRPGSSESAAREASKRRCTRARCGITGYALNLDRNSCDGVRRPSVIAEVRERTVVALRVRARGCVADAGGGVSSSAVR
jgi:hypothetical protein